MKVFRRSLIRQLPHLGGGFRRVRKTSEDRICLLESREEEEEQQPQLEQYPLEVAYDYGSDLELGQGDYINMAAAWESRCTELEATVKEMRRYHMQTPSPNDPKNKHADKRLLSALHTMKVYILQLENENEILSDTLAEREQIIKEESHPNVTTKQQQHRQPDWKMVATIASKLVEAKKEISELKYSLSLCDRDMESLISQFEELQYENERLTTKCQSLEEATSTLVKELEASERKAAEKKELPLTGEQEPVPSLPTNVGETKQTDVCKVEEGREIEPTGDDEPEILVVEEATVRKKELMESSATEGDEEGAHQSMLEGIQAGSQEEGTSCGLEEDIVIARKTEISVETVREDSEDDESSGERPEDADNALEEHANEHVTLDDSASDKVSDGETRDELGPLPSNPFESLRDDASSITNKKFGSAATSHSEMQRYLQEVAMWRHENEEAHEATMSAIQEHQRADRDTELQIDRDASRKAQDARMNILKSMNKYGRWRNKLFGRLKRNETIQQPQKARRKPTGTETDKGVWC